MSVTEDPEAEAEFAEVQRQHRDSADAVPLGWVTYESFADYWPQQTGDRTGVSDYLDRTHKYVVSATLPAPSWQNSTVLRGPVAEEVAALKQVRGRHRRHREHLSGPRAAPDRADQRVPAVRLPGGPGRRQAPVPGRLPTPRAPAGRGPVVPLGHRTAALPRPRLPHRDRHAAAARLRHPAGAVQLRPARPRAGIARRHGKELGLRNVAFEVDDLQAATDRLAADCYGQVDGIGQYEHIWRMAYVRGRRGSSFPPKFRRVAKADASHQSRRVTRPRSTT